MKGLVPAIWFTEPTFSELEMMRQKARDKQRIPYDCHNAIVKGSHVICRKGHHIGRAPGGSMLLLTVLRGRSSRQCKNCRDYDSTELE
jgi:hypothetical protein